MSKAFYKKVEETFFPLSFPPFDCCFIAFLAVSLHDKLKKRDKKHIKKNKTLKPQKTSKKGR
jgi:hypothetical protein